MDKAFLLGMIVGFGIGGLATIIISVVTAMIYDKECKKMTYFVAILFINTCIVSFVYKYGYKCGVEDSIKRHATNLHLPDKCDGCKKIKPVVTNLEHDRFGKVTTVNIGCSKFGSCGGRRDKE